MRRHPEPKGDKLNKGLCPEEFEICVPKDCRLLGEWDTCNKWKEHVGTLVSDDKLPGDYKQGTQSDHDCHTCDCKPGWILRGELAIAHARRVHDKIHRQALSFEQVSAIDVGFAIWEREGRFGDFLAIRIHVNKKRPPEQLARMGLESFTRKAFAVASLAVQPRGPGAAERPYRLPGGGDDPDPRCPHPERWFHLRELLKRALEEDKDLWKGIGRYPIGGVSLDDLSIFCPRPMAETRSLGDIRLCICGVPIDVVNADYNPTGSHPGGDADRGVFVRRPRRSNRLGNEEQLLIGRGRVNPLVGGVSVGSVTRQAGTLGTIVWDRTDATPCVLGNWHVLAGATPQVGQPVYQPAIFDGGTEDDVVAHLKRWHLGEEGDAAIAELTDDRSYASGEVLGLWHPISGYLPPRLNMEIRKFGRTTGFTQGFIDGIHLATNIDYGNGVVRFFRDQFHIAPLCAGEDVSQVGDSGSLVVTSFKPVELYEDLSKLYGWLRDCRGGQAREVLCDEIERGLEELRDDCEKLPEDCRTLLKKRAESPKDICELLDYDVYDCKKAAGLCGCLKAARRLLSEMYRKVALRAECFDYLKRELQRLYEECCSCRYGDLEVDAELERIGNSLPEECSEIEDLRGLRAESSDNPPCAIVLELLRRVRARLAALEECLEFYGRVAEKFGQWEERCSRIEEGEERCKKICEALKECDVFDSFDCKDPSAVIDCIEDFLKKPEPGGKGSKGSSVAREKQQVGGVDPDELMKALKNLLANRTDELVDALRDSAEKYRHRRKDERDREATRAYYAVGMIFAGDTPGSPFGEFAVASDISKLEGELRFSLRPVFEPRSGFRELRERPLRRGRGGRALRSGTGLTPGEQSADPRGGGPQPDLEPAQSSAGSGPGSGSGGG